MLKAMRALEKQLGILFPEYADVGLNCVWLQVWSNGQVFIKIPKDASDKYFSVQMCDGPPNDELLRVHHSIRLWFDENGFDFDAMLKQLEPALA